MSPRSVFVTHVLKTCRWFTYTAALVCLQHVSCDLLALQVEMQRMAAEIRQLSDVTPTGVGGWP